MMPNAMPFSTGDDRPDFWAAVAICMADRWCATIASMNARSKGTDFVVEFAVDG
jgi:hypothetical protein